MEARLKEKYKTEYNDSEATLFEEGRGIYARDDIDPKIVKGIQEDEFYHSRRKTSASGARR